jgi:hypothetical protein
MNIEIRMRDRNRLRTQGVAPTRFPIIQDLNHCYVAFCVWQASAVYVHQIFASIQNLNEQRKDAFQKAGLIHSKNASFSFNGRAVPLKIWS